MCDFQYLKSIMSLDRLFITFCLLLIVGCAGTRKLEKPQPAFELSEHFQSEGSLTNTLPMDWVASFQDPQLQKLVDSVLAENYSLQIAAAKLDAAAAHAKQAGASLVPTVNLGLQAGQAGTFSGARSSSSPSLGASVDIAWELDVWGRVRAANDAASQEFIAAEFDYAGARLSLVAQTAKAYFFVIKTQQLYELASASLDSYRQTGVVVQAFFDQGLVGIQDVSSARAQMSNAAAVAESARVAHLQALRSLEELLGRYPEAAADVASQFPPLPAPAPVGLPSEVLERRPDIRAAEMRVAAAFDSVQAAKMARLPRLSLTGQAGGVGDDLASIVNPSNLIWNAVSNLMFPLFDGGKLEAQVDAANANQRAALAQYQKIALRAFNEIESALSLESSLRQQMHFNRNAYQEAYRAEQISLETYQSGQGNLLDVQQLQRQTLASKRALLDAEHAIFVQRINLYLGLGGAF